MSDQEKNDTGETSKEDYEKFLSKIKDINFGVKEDGSLEVVISQVPKWLSTEDPNPIQVQLEEDQDGVLHVLISAAVKRAFRKVTNHGQDLSLDLDEVVAVIQKELIG